MTRILTLAALAASLAFASPAARAQDQAINTGLGAVAGALVGGPIGAVAGGAIGYGAGREISRGLGLSSPRRSYRRASYARRAAFRRRVAAARRQQYR